MNAKLIFSAALLVLTGATASAALLVDYNTPTNSGVASSVGDIQTGTGDTWTFSDTTPIISGATGGQNSTVYGGAITTWTIATDHNPVMNDLNADRGLQVQVIPGNGSTTTAKGMWFWKKADFLTSSTGTVAFAAGDSMSLNNSWSKATSRETRMVVNQGGTNYVSQYSSTATGVLSVDPTATQWAVLNTNNYTWGGFSAVTLNDVRGVGLYFNVSQTADFTSYRINDFQVALNAGSVAPIVLANIFGSGCVLQRDQNVKIWGTAAPGQTVTVQVKSQSVQAVADSNGKWLAALTPEPAGGPYTLTISSPGVSSVVLTNVYFGDVWLLTGQSNMELTIGGQLNAFPDLYPPSLDASDNFDDVRFVIIQPVEGAMPMDDVTLSKPWTRWQANQLSSMSAVGYYFTRALNAALDTNGMANVPLGVIKVCQGSTAAEQWISAEALAAMPEPLIEEGSKPPTGYYNGMIAPIQDYAFKGALWYQGEGNSRSHDRQLQYPLVMRTLIESWRAQWGFNFPFYYVQLAPFMDFVPNPADDDTTGISYENWAWTREAQTTCLTNSNTGMACIIDIGFQDAIHPAYKHIVGERLARIAQANTYGLNVVNRGPTVSSVAISNTTVTITYANVANGLRTQAVDAKPNADEIALGNLPVSVSSNVLAGFALCGNNKTFYWATRAEIIGTNQVRISNVNDVPNPVAIRYAWQSYPRCNLFNSEGLPAEPFRTDAYAYGTATGAELTAPRVEAFAKGTNLTVEWQPVPGTWALQSKSSLTSGSWTEVSGSRSNTAATVPLQNAGFFRLKK